jgi:hypothetical protein
MEGYTRKVRKLGEDGKGGEERNDGRHDDDKYAMTINNGNAALPSPLQLQLQLPLQ